MIRRTVLAAILALAAICWICWPVCTQEADLPSLIGVAVAGQAARPTADPFLVDQPGIRLLVPVGSGSKNQVWRYTTQPPTGDWKSLDFDDGAWKSAAGPFGAGREFIGPWRTPWNGPDIWLRRTFQIEKPVAGRLVARIFYDEDAQVYLNGKSVLTQGGYVTAPVTVPLERTASKLLRVGANVLAVHCHQTRGGQGIDVGLAAVDDATLPDLLRQARAERTWRKAPSTRLTVAPDRREDGDLLATRWAKEVTPQNVWSEYPRPAMVREKWLNLNGLWDYAIVGQPQVPRRANLIDAEADPLVQSAPARPTAWDGQILVPFAPESILSRVSRFVWPSQLLWYRRTVRLPSDWQDQRVILHFEAVDWHCIVWVNGRKVGEHQGGYTPLACDITEAVKPDGPQEITLVVWDPTNAGDQSVGKQQLPSGRPELRYPPTSGIWQTVWLEPVPAVSIEHLLLTPDVDRSVVVARVKLRGKAAGCELDLRAMDGQRLVASATGDAAEPLTSPNSAAKAVESRFPVPVRRDGHVAPQWTDG